MLTNDLEAYYIFKDEPNRGTLLAVRSLLLDYSHDITEAYKWKTPFFVYKSKNLCYFHINTKTEIPYIGFMNGAHIKHPDLIPGDRKHVKIYELDPENDLPYQCIEEIIQLAMDYEDSKSV